MIELFLIAQGIKWCEDVNKRRGEEGYILLKQLFLKIILNRNGTR